MGLFGMNTRACIVTQVAQGGLDSVAYLQVNHNGLLADLGSSVLDLLRVQRCREHEHLQQAVNGRPSHCEPCALLQGRLRKKNILELLILKSS